MEANCFSCTSSQIDSSIPLDLKNSLLCAHWKKVKKHLSDLFGKPAVAEILDYYFENNMLVIEVDNLQEWIIRGKNYNWIKMIHYVRPIRFQHMTTLTH
jgi:hypothetical protein